MRLTNESCARPVVNFNSTHSALTGHILFSPARDHHYRSLLS